MEPAEPDPEPQSEPEPEPEPPLTVHSFDVSCSGAGRSPSSSPKRALGEAEDEGPLPPGWTREESRAYKGQFFFYHAATNTSRWQRPEHPSADGSRLTLEPEAEPQAAAEEVVRKIFAIFLTESAQKKDKDGKAYVLYGARVHVVYESGKEGEWWIFRRYSEWLALYEVLLKIRGGGPMCPKPPPKNVLRNLDRNAVEKRKVELNKWLAEVASNTRFSESATFIDWLHEGRVADASKRNVAPADMQIRLPSFKLATEKKSDKAWHVYTLAMDSSMVPGWEVEKRFSDFVALWEALEGRHPTIALPPIPPKKVVVTDGTANHRRKTLERALQAAYRIPELATDETMLSFLQAPPLIHDTAAGAAPTMQGELAVGGQGSIDQRWFELRGTGLSYAREQFAHWEGSVNLVKAAQGIMAVAAPPDGSTGASRVLVIQGQGAELRLRAPTDDGFREWAAAIFHAAGRPDDAAAVGGESSQRSSVSSSSSGGGTPLGRAASFVVEQRLSRKLSGSPLVTDGRATPRGCAPEVVTQLRTMLRTASGLEELQLTVACEADAEGEYVAMASLDNEYAVLRMAAAPSAAPPPPPRVECALALGSRMRFSQPDRRTVLISSGPSSSASGAAAGDEGEGGAGLSCRMRTELDAAILLEELEQLHGVVAKQGLMAALSGFGWLEALDAAECVIDTAGAAADSESIGALGRRTVDSAAEYWAPEGGWVVPPRPQDDEQESGGAAVIEEAVLSARGVELGGAESELAVITSELGKKSVMYYEVALRQSIGGAEASWSVPRRFSHFEDLRAALRSDAAVAALAFPAKATKGGAVAGTDPKVVAARQAGLHEWLSAVLELCGRSEPELGADDTAELSARPELLVFLGMHRAAQRQVERRRSGAGSRKGGRLGAKMADTTDKLGRSIEVLIGSQEDTENAAVLSSHLAECAAFRCVIPRLLFQVRESSGVRRRSKTLWLAPEVMELRGAVGVPTVTVPYSQLISVQNTSPTEFKLAWFGEAADAASGGSGQGVAPAGLSTAMELQDMSMDEPLDSADWQPSATAAESVSGMEELRSRHEMRLAYSGSGPPTTRIAAELSDRKNLAFHIRTKRQKKREASPTDPAAAGAGADARKERLDSHLRQVTGMTEAERITDAVHEILAGERAEDERALRRWHRFLDEMRGAPPAAAKVKELREMMTLVRRELLENRRASLLPLLNTLPEEGDGLEHDSLNLLVDATIERFVMDALEDDVWECLRAAQSGFEKAEKAEKAAAFDSNRAELRRKPQDYFDIPEANRSGSGWRAALAALNQMDKQRLPTEKLRTLLRTKDAILRTYTEEHPQTPRPGQDVSKVKAATLAGDDFQPIFIYMVCQCDVAELGAQCQMLWDLCEPRMLVGEGGYYLTQFESAVYFIASWESEEQQQRRQEQEQQRALAEETLAKRAALETEVVQLLQQESVAEGRASAAISEGERRKAKAKVREAQRRVEELRAVIGDEEVSIDHSRLCSCPPCADLCRLASGAGALR